MSNDTSQQSALALPSFAKILPSGKWKLTLDNHLVETFDTCALKFRYRHIDNIAPKGARNLKIELGSWWSEFMRSYYEAFARGALDGPGADTLVQKLAAQAWLDLDMSFFGNDPMNAKAFTAFGGSMAALGLARQYHLYYRDIDRRELRVIGAESSFGAGQVLVGSNQFVELYLSGIPDLVVLADGKYLAPLDHKTKDHLTKDVIEECKPSGQFIGYCVAVRALAEQLGYAYPVDFCIVNLVARLLPAEPRDNARQKTPRFWRERVYFSADEVAEWTARRLALATRLRFAIENNQFFMTDNSTSCHRYYGRACPYRQICKKPTEHRQTVIQANYTAAKPWAPHRASSGDADSA